jgi:hypothetical protein
VYYGVVEAQGRGSLRIHILIWLDHRLSPVEIKKQMEDLEFKEKAFRWYEDIISHDIPEGTVPYNQAACAYKGELVMSRSVYLLNEQKRAQDIRDVIENTAQIHPQRDLLQVLAKDSEEYEGQRQGLSISAAKGTAEGNSRR